MRLTKIKTERFRGLPDVELEIPAGLSIWQGPNESGKSSLREAIETVLYCSADSSAAQFQQAVRWGAQGGIGLTLAFVLRDGAYTLLRDFNEGRNLLTGPGGQWKGNKAVTQALGERLPIPTRDGWRAIACVGPDQMAEVAMHTDDLARLIERHVLTGSGVDVLKIQQALDARVAELRKGSRAAAKTPGPIRQHQDRKADLEAHLRALDGELAAAATAAEDLSRVQERIATLRAERASKQDRVGRHTACREAERVQEQALSRYGEAMQLLDKAADLDRNLPGLGTAATQAEDAVRDQEEAVARLEQAATTAEKLETARAEVAQLEVDLAEIARHAAAIREAARRIAALPLTLAEIDNLEALPGEIAGMRADIQTADEARARLTQELETCRESLRTVEEEQRAAVTLEACLRRRIADLGRRGQHQARRGDLVRQRDGWLERVHEGVRLQAALRVLTDAHDTTTHLSGLTADEFRELDARVAALQQTMGEQGVEVTVEPTAHLRITVAADGATPHQVDVEPTPTIFTAHHEIHLGIPAVATLRVRSAGALAESLAGAEQRLAERLSQARCPTVAEVLAALAEREKCARAITETTKALYAALGGEDSTTLDARVSELNASLAVEEAALETLPTEAAPEEGLRADLGEVQRQSGALESRVRALNERITEIPRALATDVVQQTRGEVARKSHVLADLQAKLGPASDAASVCRMAHTQWTDARETAEAERSRILRDRRAEHLEQRRMDLGKVLEGLATALQAAGGRPDVETLSEARSRLDARKGDAQAARAARDLAQASRTAIDREALTQQRTRSAFDGEVAARTIKENGEYVLAPEELTQFRQRIEAIDADLPDLLRTSGQLDARATDDSSRQTQRAETVEMLDITLRSLASLEQHAAVDEQVANLIKTARGQAIGVLRDQELPRLAARYVEQLTAGRYSAIEVQGERTTLVSAQKGSALADAELSSGTRDQFYLAVRLAYLVRLCGFDRAPLVLDDPLIHTDPARRQAVLGFLAEYAAGPEGGQVLLFTCHDFPEYAAYPVRRVGPVTP
jgi:uncharacterized protein YhaN